MKPTRQVIRATAVAIAATAVVGGVAAAADATGSTRPPNLQKSLAQLVAAGAPGAILLTREGNRTTSLSSGLADVDANTPMRTDDRFRLASLTKTYVATVVLQLAGERKLSLNDPVQRFLPGLVPNGSRITIRELLDHTSGLFDYERDLRVLKPYLSGNLAYHWPPLKLVKLALAHKPLFQPGARYSYSNTNFMIAGLIIEAITGKPLGSELRRRVFSPLHLHATSFPLTPRIPGPYAHGYYLLGQPPATDASGLSPFPWAAGAVIFNGQRRRRLLPSTPHRTPAAAGPPARDGNNGRRGQKPVGHSG